MHCDQKPTMLASYLDGELPLDQAVRVQEHIGSCAQCAAEIAEFVRLQRSLRAARGHFVPSAEFRQKLQRQLVAPKRSPWPMRLIPVTLAIAALLLISARWVHYSYRADMFAELADLHVNALASANPVDVVSTDRHTVKPWFQGRIPFAFNIPELTGSEFTLLGGRLVYLHQRPGAQLIFSMRQHKISVLIFQESPELARAFPVTSGISNRNSFSVETWETQGLRFLVIGDTDPDEIAKLAQAIKKVNA